MRRISHDLSGIIQRLNHLGESFNHEADELAKSWVDVKGRAFIAQHTSEVQPSIGQLIVSVTETAELFENIARKLKDPKDS
jgi:hypothetical protein